MVQALRYIDDLAGITSTGIARMLERLAFVFLVLMVLFAPHSIAATQSAWLIGMTAWVIRIFVTPRPQIRIGRVGIWLLIFLGWSFISALFSYEPLVSANKLRGVAVLLIFFFVFNVVRRERAAIFLAFSLIMSCMVVAVWTPIQKLIGKGVEMSAIGPDGAMARAGVQNGDVIIRVNGKAVNSPNDAVNAMEGRESSVFEFNRLDAVFVRDVASADLLPEGNGERRLGFAGWKRGHGFRAAGFYGHFTTFAEMLQLVGALLIGLLIAAVSGRAPKVFSAALAVCAAFLGLALLFTVTRASQLSFMISSGISVLAGAGRRLAITAILITVPIAAIGLYFLQKQRQVGFFDARDGSIQYREMMWRDGFRLWKESPRNIVLGVGMDSIKTHWIEWHLFDNGFQPMGHFHSTPMQLLVERGFPALIIWLILLGTYLRTLWRSYREQTLQRWRVSGILLGTFSGAIGFFCGGLVHYNLGDAEVAMIFYILMGLSLSLVSVRQTDMIDLDSPILRQ